MLVCDNRGHPYLKSICQACRELDNGHGDIWIYKDGESEPRLKFEVKSLSDFWTRHTGKDELNHQLRFIDGIVVIMGDEEENYDEQKLMDTFNGVNDHHRVYKVKDVNHLLRFIKRRELKINQGTWCVIELRHPKFVEYRKWVNALSNAEGIGLKTAHAICNHFKNIEELIADCKSFAGDPKLAKKSKLCEVENVGPQKAQNVADFLLADFGVHILPGE
jgi:hypothetical protein